MSLILLLMAVLDLAGVFFNIRMLRSCFKDTTKYTILQKCKTISICQCACQVIILVTGAVESWTGFHDQFRESCIVFKLLWISVMFLQACNITAILIIDSDHSLVCRNRDVSSKLKMAATLFWGFVGSTMIWWYSCFPQEFISPMTFIVIQLILLVMFVVLLLAAGSRNNIHDQLNNTNTDTLINSSLVWKFCKENKRPVFFITLLLICLVVILSGLYRTVHPSESLLSQDFEQTRVFKEALHSFIPMFVDGIVLPVTFSDWIDSSDQEGNEMKLI